MWEVRKPSNSVLTQGGAYPSSGSAVLWDYYRMFPWAWAVSLEFLWSCMCPRNSEYEKGFF